MEELQKIFSKMELQLQELNKVLNTEQQLLINNHLMNALSPIIDAKTELLLELKTLDEQRIELGQQYGLVQPYENDEVLAKEWSKVAEMTRSLAQLNKDNGRILEIRLERVKDTINFLHKVNNADCYNNGGYSQTGNILTSRAKA